ncbi:hypothetical protein ACS0TY_011477 [Phlomoides rotata]
MNSKPARYINGGQECITKLHSDFETTLADDLHTPVLQQLKDKALRRAGVTEDDVLHSIEERMLARKNKGFSKGDQIRSDLAAKGIALMDDQGPIEDLPPAEEDGGSSSNHPESEKEGPPAS